jgi:hypothetical protein
MGTCHSQVLDPWGNVTCMVKIIDLSNFCHHRPPKRPQPLGTALCSPILVVVKTYRRAFMISSLYTDSRQAVITCIIIYKVEDR